jgi:hypothetical protein
MTTRILIWTLFGYSVGSLPHDGIGWAAFHLAFAVVLLVLGVRAAKREAGMR